ncbi:MAG: hypothetical protein US75_C0012G0040, partial [Candidatus Woesebacteria bacterium GW2011_GWC1_38_13]
STAAVGEANTRTVGEGDGVLFGVEVGSVTIDTLNVGVGFTGDTEGAALEVGVKYLIVSGVWVSVGIIFSTKTTVGEGFKSARSAVLESSPVNNLYSE